MYVHAQGAHVQLIHRHPTQHRSYLAVNLLASPHELLLAFEPKGDYSVSATRCANYMRSAGKLKAGSKHVNILKYGAYADELWHAHVL